MPLQSALQRINGCRFVSPMAAAEVLAVRLSESTKGKRSLGKSKCSWEDNIARYSAKELIAYFPLIRQGPCKVKLSQ
jgi:hypothetical protein